MKKRCVSFLAAGMLAVTLLTSSGFAANTCSAASCDSIWDVLALFQTEDCESMIARLESALTDYFMQFWQGSTDTNVAQPDETESDTETEDLAPDATKPDTDGDNAQTDEETPGPDGDAPAPGETDPGTDVSDPSTEAPEESGLHAYELEVIRLVNEIRGEYGLGTLAANGDLSRVARYKSQDMGDNGYFSHTGPTYGSPFDMMTTFGISYRTAGENIAMGYTTPQAVVDGWMNSSGHRANILSTDFSEIGVGYIESGHYWTQMFIG